MKFKFILVLVISSLLLSCDEEGDEKIFNRLIYLGVSDYIDGSRYSLGLHAYNLTDDTYEQLVTHPVPHISSVGENGVITFDYETTENRLFGRCEDGSIVNVPMPNADGVSYDLINQPKIELTKDGHNIAVFFKVFADGTEDPDLYDLVLYQFNCKTAEAKFFDIETMVTNSENEIEFDRILPYGRNILFNEDLSRAWFIIQYIDNNDRVVGYRLYELRNGELIEYSEIQDTPIELLGLDYETFRPILRRGEKVYTFWYEDQVEQFAENPIPLSYLKSQKQFVKALSEVVVWSDYGIEIFSPVYGASLKRLFSYNELESELGDGYNFDSEKIVSISTDGDWIAFGLERSISPGAYDIYAFDRIEKKIISVYANVSYSIPSVSPLYEDK